MLPHFTGHVAVVAFTQPWVRVPLHRFVLLVVGAVLVLRVGYLTGPLASDEAGYLLVAESWRRGGPNLYGHYFVDRPPLLITLYRVAALTGWAPTVRVLATGFSVLLVVAAAWAAHQVAGDRGARWAAMVAAALVTTPMLAAQEADGEIFAAPLVMLAVALTLAAVRRAGWRSFLPAVAAGVAAGSAVMVKQNFVDGVVFAGVLVLASVAQRRLSGRDSLRVVAGGCAGGVLVVLGALGFVAWSRVGIAVAWTDVFGVRSSALDVIEDHSLHAPMLRATSLVVLAVVAGLLPMLAALVVEAVRRRGRGSPVAWAVGATLLVEVVSIAMGGSYWAHYLLQLAPMLALAAGLWAADAARVRACAALVVAASVAASSVILLSGAAFGHRDQRVGAWLHASSRPGDTVTQLFGNADAQQASGMASPYPQLWTLPMRTLDPHLSQLRAVLRSPHAPTWVVAWGDLDPWRIDAHGLTRRTLAQHYEPVADVCGHVVYLHDGLRRDLAPVRCR